MNLFLFFWWDFEKSVSSILHCQIQRDVETPRESSEVHSIFNEERFLSEDEDTGVLITFAQSLPCHLFNSLGFRSKEKKIYNSRIERNICSKAKL